MAQPLSASLGYMVAYVPVGWSAYESNGMNGEGGWTLCRQVGPCHWALEKRYVTFLQGDTRPHGYMPVVHGGSWNAASDAAAGRITKEAADKAITAARTNRKRRRAQGRAR